MKKKIKEKIERETNKSRNIPLREKKFQGEIIKKFDKRAVVYFERLLFVNKYERYEKRNSKIHAKIPDNLNEKIKIGDIVEIKECRPISKLIKFIVTKKIRSKNETSNSKN